MRTKYHYYLRKKDNLLQFLNKYNVGFTITVLPEADFEMCSFDLFDDQEAFVHFRMHYPFSSYTIKSVEYCVSEIENADWLFVRSKNAKVEWIYEEDAFTLSCPYRRFLQRDLRYNHMEQSDFLTVSEPVKWSNRQYFCGPNTADDLLFCSALAKTLLADRWNGLEFLPVKKGRSTEYHNDLYQLFFVNRLPFAALQGGKQSKCRSCGSPFLRLPNGQSQLEIRKEFLNMPDCVYTTGNNLSGQLVGAATYSANIVPHSFYQYCKERQMNRGMIYEPVKVV